MLGQTVQMVDNLIKSFKGGYVEIKETEVVRKWESEGSYSSQEVIWVNSSQHDEYQIFREDGTSHIVDPGENVSIFSATLRRLCINQTSENYPLNHSCLIAVILTTVKNKQLLMELKENPTETTNAYIGVNWDHVRQYPHQYHTLHEFIPMTQVQWDAGQYYWFKDGRVCIAKLLPGGKFDTSRVTFPSKDYRQMVAWANERKKEIDKELFYEYVNIVASTIDDGRTFYINRGGAVYSINPTLSEDEEAPGVYVEYSTHPSNLPDEIREKGELVDPVRSRFRFNLADCIYDPNRTADTTYPYVLYTSIADARNDEYSVQLKRLIQTTKKEVLKERELALEEAKMEGAEKSAVIEEQKLVRKDHFESKSAARKDESEDLKQVAVVFAGCSTVVAGGIALSKILASSFSFSFGFGFLGAFI